MKKLTLVLVSVISLSPLLKSNDLPEQPAKTKTDEQKEMRSTVKAETIMEFVHNIYVVEGCGICKKRGADVFWWSPYSRCAHRDCFRMLEGLGRSFYAAADRKFGRRNYQGQNLAHIEVAREIERHISDRAESIKEFIGKYGIEEIEKIYESETKKLDS